MEKPATGSSTFPLDDIEVLDVTQVVSGSFASMLLADMGAEVVKIERPDGGEIGRSNPPFVNGRSSYFMAVNRNKKSVTLDLSSDRGREVFIDLACDADVIVENLKPGSMEKLGLGYDAISKENESIIYCSISGFGQTGPYSDYPALDIVAQGFSGNMSITGPPEDKPYRSGTPIGDIAASMYAVQSVVAALLHREQTGQGQYLDVAMTDGLISWLSVRAGYTFGTGKPYPRRGNELDEFVPYGVFETTDSHVGIAVVQDHHWQNLCDVISEESSWTPDGPPLSEDERFQVVEGRRKYREILNSILDTIFQEKSSDEWFELLSGKLPVMPVHDTKSVWEDEQVQARNLFEDIDIGGQDHRFINPAVKYSETPLQIRRRPPELGQHTRAKLEESGYSSEAIEEMADDGIIATDPE